MALAAAPKALPRGLLVLLLVVAGFAERGGLDFASNNSGAQRGAADHAANASGEALRLSVDSAGRAARAKPRKLAEAQRHVAGPSGGVGAQEAAVEAPAEGAAAAGVLVRRANGSHALSDLANLSVGNDLNMAKCTDKAFESMHLGKTGIYCTEIWGEYKEFIPDGDKLQKYYHCGVRIYAKEEPKKVRQFDLEFVPDNQLVRIDCSENKDLKWGGMKEWKHGKKTDVLRDWTYDKLEKFISDTMIVSAKYDIYGGNCQHWAATLFEVLAKRPCYSTEMPNDSGIAEVVEALSLEIKEVKQGILDHMKEESDELQKKHGKHKLEGCDGDDDPTAVLAGAHGLRGGRPALTARLLVLAHAAVAVSLWRGA